MRLLKYWDVKHEYKKSPYAFFKLGLVSRVENFVQKPRIFSQVRDIAEERATE